MPIRYTERVRRNMYVGEDRSTIRWIVDISSNEEIGYNYDFDE